LSACSIATHFICIEALPWREKKEMNNACLSAINIAANLNMQQVRVNRETLHESINRERGPRESPVIVHTELSSLVNDYTHSQQHCMKNFFFVFSF